jgi:hypothetical protein
MIRIIFGLILVVDGIVLGLYVGVWLMFIGGIVQVVNAIQVHPVHAMDIAVGFVRVFGATAAGALSFVLCVICGFGLIRSGDKAIPIRFRERKPFNM